MAQQMALIPMCQTVPRTPVAKFNHELMRRKLFYEYDQLQLGLQLPGKNPHKIRPRTLVLDISVNTLGTAYHVAQALESYWRIHFPSKNGNHSPANDMHPRRVFVGLQIRPVALPNNLPNAYFGVSVVTNIPDHELLGWLIEYANMKNYPEIASIRFL